MACLPYNPVACLPYNVDRDVRFVPFNGVLERGGLADTDPVQEAGDRPMDTPRGCCCCCHHADAASSRRVRPVGYLIATGSRGRG